MIPHSEFKDGRLLKSKTIAVNDLENGDYRLIVNLRQAGSSEVLASANLPLRISATKSELPLYFLSDTQALGRPGVAAYMRALEAISQKNDAAAADYFRQALDQNPANTFAGQDLVQLYFSQRKYAPDRGSLQETRHRGLQGVSGHAGPDRAQLPPEWRRRSGTQRDYRPAWGSIPATQRFRRCKIARNSRHLFPSPAVLADRRRVIAAPDRHSQARRTALSPPACETCRRAPD